MPGIGKDRSAGGGRASEARTGAEVPLGMGMGVEEAPLSTRAAMKARLRKDPGCQGLPATKIRFQGTNREQKEQTGILGNQRGSSWV